MNSRDGFAWTALPPLPIMGVGTSLVESAEHYACRLAWTSGITMSQLRLLFPKPGRGCSSSGSSGFCGPGRLFEERISWLEKLCGVESIRCGTFSVLNSVLSSRALNKSSARHRWCPRCYLEWDERTSYEPLLWRVNLTVFCPVHLCALETSCESCDSPQAISRSYEERRICSSCSRSLSGHGRTFTPSDYASWAQKQVTELIELCANPGQRPIEHDAYLQFVRGVAGWLERPSSLPRQLRLSYSDALAGRKSRAGLNIIIGFAAFQGISAVELLTNPRAAASPPLLPGVDAFTEIDAHHRHHVLRVAAFDSCVAKIYRRCRNIFLPPLQLLLEAARTNVEITFDDIGVRSRYQRAFAQQDKFFLQPSAGVVFRQAIKAIANSRRVTEARTKRISKSLSETHGLPNDEVDAIVVTALVCWAELSKFKHWR
jgi:hypothetical protein